MKTHIHWLRRHPVATVMVIGAACLTAAGCIGGSRGLFSDLRTGDSRDEELKESYLDALKKSGKDEDKSSPGRVRISDLGASRGILKTGYRTNPNVAPRTSAGKSGQASPLSRNATQQTRALPEDPFIEAITERPSAAPHTQSRKAPSPAEDLVGTKNPFRRIPSDSALAAERTLPPSQQITRKPAGASPRQRQRQVALQGNKFVSGFDKQMEMARTRARAAQPRPIQRIPDDVAVARTKVVRDRQAASGPIDIRGQLANLMDTSRSELASGKLAAAYRNARLADRLSKTAGIKWPLAAQTPGELVAEIRTKMLNSGRGRPSAVELQEPELADDGSDMEIVPRTSHYVPRQAWQRPAAAPRRPLTTRERLAALQRRLESQSMGTSAAAEMIVDTRYVPSRLAGEAVDLKKAHRDAALIAAQRAMSGPDATGVLTPILAGRPGLLKVHGASASPADGAVLKAGYPKDGNPDDVALADFTESPSEVKVEAIELGDAADEGTSDGIQWQDGSSLSEEEPVDSAPEEKAHSSGSVLPLIVCLALGAAGVLLVLRWRRWSDTRRAS